MKTFNTPAFAKINLSLDILGKLPDGYHSVEMIMQQIPLYDEVSVTVDNGNGISLSCNNPDIPTDNKNTAYSGGSSMVFKSAFWASSVIFSASSIK